MSAAVHSQPLASILALRTAVAYLGERPQCAWWDTAFLNQTGFQYLGLIVPKTAVAAALTAAWEGACRAHDERIGRGRVVHLFRLPPELEMAISAESRGTSVEEMSSRCSVDRAFAVLDEIAMGVKGVIHPGPVQIGKSSDVLTGSFTALVAATFAAGFRASTPVFPYLG